MKLTAFEIFHYRLPLATALTTGDSAPLAREGLLVRLRDDSGAFGWGECAPLPPLSEETVDVVAGQLKKLRTWAIDRNLPDGLEKLDGAFDSWLDGIGLAPSVRCAFEIACLRMIAQPRGQSLAELLSPDAGRTVKVNALIELSQRDALDRAASLKASGYEAFKLKVGRQTIEQDIFAVVAIRKAVGDQAVLRLDANQLWTAQSLMAVWSEVEQCGIDYFEEPVPDTGSLIVYLKKWEISLPLALDESLSQPDADELIMSPHVTALVVKPTALGLEQSVRLMRKAHELGKPAVISSTFESSIGISALVQVAAAFADPSVAMGLDTGGWLAADLLEEPVASQGGRFVISDLPAIPERIESDLLTEMLCDE